MPKETKKRELLNQIDAYRIARDTIKELYESEGGKKLIHHLITVFNSEKPRLIIFSKNDLWDCLSGSLVNSVFPKGTEVPEKVLELNKLINSTEDEHVANEIRMELNDVLESYLKEHQIHRYAYRAENSNKILGVDELQALSDFIDDQIKAKNSVIFNTMHHINPEKYPRKSSKNYKSNSKQSGKSKSQKPVKVSDAVMEEKLKALQAKFNNR